MKKNMTIAVILGVAMIVMAVLFAQWRNNAVARLTLTPEASKVLPA